MATPEILVKKITRLKNKLKELAAALEGKEEGRQALRLWHKRLKRTQRKKKSLEAGVRHMETKKTKKKGEEGKEAVKPEPAAG